MPAKKCICSSLHGNSSQMESCCLFPGTMDDAFNWLKMKLLDTPCLRLWPWSEHEVWSVWLKSDLSISGCEGFLEAWVGESIHCFTRKKSEKNQIDCCVTGIFSHGRWCSRDNEAVSQSVHHFGPDCNISTTIGWIAMKFSSDIHPRG